MCCVFSIGNGPWRHRPPAGAPSQFLLNQYYCYWTPATSRRGATFTNLQCGASSSATFTNIQCALLQVHHSPISSVAPSTSVAPIITVALLQLHRSTVLFHLLATILSHVIMQLDDSILSIISLPLWILLVYYLTASLKSKFLQLKNMLPSCRLIYSTVVIQLIN